MGEAKGIQESCDISIGEVIDILKNDSKCMTELFGQGYATFTTLRHMVAYTKAIELLEKDKQKGDKNYGDYPDKL